MASQKRIGFILCLDFQQGSCFSQKSQPLLGNCTTPDFAQPVQSWHDQHFLVHAVGKIFMRLDSCLGFIWSCISVIQHTDESRQHLSAPRGASATENDNMFIVHTPTGMWRAFQQPCSGTYRTESTLFEGARSSPGESFTVSRSLSKLNVALRKEKRQKSPVRAPCWSSYTELWLSENCIFSRVQKQDAGHWKTMGVFFQGKKKKMKRVCCCF
jgi:hypothetical protein